MGTSTPKLYCHNCKFGQDYRMKCTNPMVCQCHDKYEEYKRLEIRDGIGNVIAESSNIVTAAPDMVNHPKHYIHNGMEAIDVIQAFTDGLNGIEATDTGNIIKYALRWKDKNGVEDLKKIVWYTNHLINCLEGKK